MINVLFAGDIVGSKGCEFARKCICRLKGQEKIDLVIVNGENSADGNGITRQSADELFTFADVITTGNHCFRRREFVNEYDHEEFLVRPANYPEGVNGKGVCIIDKGRYSVAVVNIMGTSFMEPLGNPFECAEQIISGLDTPNIIIDFHAEATSEKKSLGFFLQGKVSAVLGTHTHVQTADEMILQDHTAYITDVGMCGAELSVLGVKSELAILKQRYKMPVKFSESDNPPFFCAVMLKIDEKTGKAVEINRLQMR